MNDPKHEPRHESSSGAATRFSDLGLIEPLLRAVQESGYAEPTPIQAQAIPLLLEEQDLLGCARTGTGKTAAFALPMLQMLSKRRAGRGEAGRPPVRALVLVPTRELAAQVAESFRTYGRYLPLSVVTIYGGVGQDPQVRALQRGVDIVVATPGRLVDLMGQGHARLNNVEILVLDEADHMLDLGFIPDVRRILSAIPRDRQTLFFSATMPPPITQLAQGMLKDPARVFVTPVASTVELVDQCVHFVSRQQKPSLLAHLLSDKAVERVLVFTRTKHGANRVAQWLTRGNIPAEAIHGNKSQTARERTLLGFKRGRVRVLVATDIAARGIDVDDITHVVNFDLPNVPETYVHRIGRTARAGASGVAISLCDPEERVFLRDIEKLIKHHLRVVGDPDHRGVEHVRAELERPGFAPPAHAASRPAAALPRPAAPAAPRDAHFTRRGEQEANRARRDAAGGMRRARRGNRRGPGRGPGQGGHGGHGGPGHGGHSQGHGPSHGPRGPRR